MKIKTLSFVLVVAMLFNLTIFASAESEHDGDVTKEFETLTALGIIKGYENVDFNPNLRVKRAAFCAPVARLLGFNESADSKLKVSSFSDVRPEYWNSVYIEYLLAKGIIDMNESGEFRPEDDITYLEAVKILVSAMGYRFIAESKGGFPTGYLEIATQNRLLASVGNDEGFITYGAAVRMIYNSLNAEILEEVSLGTRGFGYQKRGNTFLSLYLDIKVVEGIVTANWYTHIKGHGKAKKEHVIINEEVLSVGTTNAADFLGENVRAYVKSGEDDNIILTIESYRNNIVFIDYNDIPKIKPSELSLSHFEFYNNDRIERVYLSPELEVIYNNSAYTDFVMSDFYIQSGFIKLIDNDNDMRYDLAVICEYENYFVKSVDLASNQISDKYGKILNFNSDTVFYDNKGNFLAASNVVSGNVLSVLESKYSENIVVYVCNDKVTGIVEKVEQYQDDEEYIINNTAYKMSSSYLAAKRHPEYYSISLGDDVVLHLDYMGTVAGVSKNYSEEFKYGYLINAVPSRGLDARLQFKIYTQNDEMKVFDSKEKLIVDNVVMKNSDEILSALHNGETNAAKNNIKQLIRFAEQDGVIKEIDTVKQTMDESSDNLRQMLKSEARLRYKAKAKTFSRSFFITGETRLFMIPSDETEEQAYKVIGYGELVNDKYYDVIAYTVNKFNPFATVLVMFDQYSSEPSNTSPIYLVENITKAIYNETEIVEKLVCYQGAAKQEIYGTESDTFSKSNISSGDVIRLGINSAGRVDTSNGKLGNIVKIYDYSENKFMLPSNPSGSVISGGRVSLSEVYRTFESGIIEVSLRHEISEDGDLIITKVDPADIKEDDVLEKRQISLFKVVKYDGRLKKASTATQKDIKDYVSFGADCSRIVSFEENGEPRTIIIYND